jgi:EpsI family protein
VAFLRGFGPVLGTCLLASSIGVVILVNIVRVVLSGIIQEATDRKYIMGAWHEGLGFALVFVGLAGILACAKLFDRLAVHEASPGPASQAPQQIQVWKVSGMTVLTLALVLGVAAWPHLRETESQSLSFPKSAAALPQRLHHWEGVDQPVDDFITSELAAAEVLHRQYQDNLGRSVETWVIRWDSAHPGRGYHHPDICLPARGYRVEKRWDQPIATSRGTFTATARILRHEQHGLMVLYWTEQDGRVWTHEEEADAEAMMGGYPAMKQAFKLLVNGQRLRGGLRQTILIGVPDASGQALDLAEEFARHLFEHLSMTGSSSAPQTRPR